MHEPIELTDYACLLTHFSLTIRGQYVDGDTDGFNRTE